MERFVGIGNEVSKAKDDTLMLEESQEPLLVSVERFTLDVSFHASDFSNVISDFYGDIRLHKILRKVTDVEINRRSLQRMRCRQEQTEFMVPIAPIDEDNCSFSFRRSKKLPSHRFRREGSGFSTIIVGTFHHQIKFPLRLWCSKEPARQNLFDFFHFWLKKAIFSVPYPCGTSGLLQLF